MYRSAVIFGVVSLVVYILAVAKSLLLPLVFAFGFWYLINTLATRYANIRITGYAPPRFLCFLAAVLTFGGAIWFIFDMIFSNIAEVASLAPTYQLNLERRMEQAVILLGLDQTPTIQELTSYLNFGQLLTSLARTFTGIAGTLVIITVYVGFMLFEQRSFDHKLDAMIDDNATEKRVRSVLKNIDLKIQKYLWVKTLMSALTGLLSYAVIEYVGVDFAEFWALIIFFLNYIPTIGSLLGIIFPALLTLIQFDDISEFITVAIGLSAVQMSIGNFLDPRMMGESLNLSPLVIILSLALWGSIWGFPGMFLAVPIMVSVAIVLAQFERTRGFAVIMSKDGKIEGVTLDH